jgi:indole-3-glycerol phosphate synthase
MLNVLEEIIAQKRERVRVARDATSLLNMRALAYEVRMGARPFALRNKLRASGINIIAEFKRRSPSKGPIRADADAAQVAQMYQAGGAAGISVLTEEDYFGGSLDDLRKVKRAVEAPVLRKDFVFDEYQIYESAAAGADAVLLIVAALEDEMISHLVRTAETELRMDALVEVHTSEELKRAVAGGASLIGVNNRDLRTFEVSLETSLSLARDAPRDSLLISESGLQTAADLQRLSEVGYRGFLIGETLMRAEDPGQLLRELRSV